MDNLLFYDRNKAHRQNTFKCFRSAPPNLTKKRSLVFAWLCYSFDLDVITVLFCLYRFTYIYMLTCLSILFVYYKY